MSEKNINWYKSIFKNYKTRKKILSFLKFIPDKIMLKLQYRIKLGRKLNLKNPERFTEKIQYYKLSYDNYNLPKYVDKYEVRKYIKAKGLESHLVKLLGVYSTFDEINYEILPREFVAKTTNGGGGNDIIISTNESFKDIDYLKKNLSLEVIEKNTGGRERPYYYIKPRLIIEELLIDENNKKGGVSDYKFLCYHGIPKIVIVDVDRYIGHKRNFYDMDWNNLNIISDCPPIDREICKPKQFEQMQEIASILSEDFPFVRVDLYNVNGKIYFGELTFYPWSGYVQFIPDEADYLLGESRIENYE